MMIQTFPDPECLSRAAARLLAELAKEGVRTRGRFSVALSGGSTPRRTYEILAGPPCREQIPWERLHVFWGDERCVGPDDPRSNARMAREALLEHVPLSRDRMHPISCQDSPETGAREYEALLRDFFKGAPPRLDLVFLGLGADGHTASLFPGDAALGEQERWSAVVRQPGSDLSRVTLTPVVLNQAAVVAFLVAGAAKAGVLRQVLHGPYEPERLPAQLIKPETGKLYWLLDQEAARLLP